MAFPIQLRSLQFLTILTVCLCSGSVARGAARSGQADDGAQRVPVLVELFTSEGCSDCPPADALLGELDRKQFVPGAEAIVLSEHVTYWNHLGWRDPFSLDVATQRQEEYVRRFGLDSAYTPQIVVDGTSQFVGSDRRALVSALTKAVAKPKIHLAIESARWDAGSVHFTLRAEKLNRAKLIVALASDATHSEVARGENAGRTLHHTAVVRTFKELDARDVDGRTISIDGGGVPRGVNRDGKIRLVVFAVDHEAGRVITAAEQGLQ